MKAKTEKIALTAGNINNNYIRICQFRDIITGDLGVSDYEITLELEDVGQVATKVDKEKGILAERKAIGRFFRVHELEPGDEIELEQIGENHFQVRANHKEGKVASATSLSEVQHGPKEEVSPKAHLPLFEAKKAHVGPRKQRRAGNLRRANDLDGREWTSNSISIWRDIRKTGDELHLDHPAMFPVMLVKRIVRCFTTSAEKMILDPFMGSGSTLVGACLLGRKGIGFEIYPDYIELAKQRLSICTRTKGAGSFVIYPQDARNLADFIEPNSIDFCFTSPPYWNILTQRRTADYKEVRNYGDSASDLGRINNYRDFVDGLGKIFREVLRVLKPGKYCVVNVMDLRKKHLFYPFHSDLAYELQRVGYVFDDIIIWDRSHEYSNLRPLGYPAVFRINKVHEYLVIFQKPKLAKGAQSERKKD